MRLPQWSFRRKRPAEVRVAVADQLVLLRQYHPRHTKERIAAVRQLGEMRLSADERAEVATQLLRILKNQAREPTRKPVERALGGAYRAGAITGAIISIARIFFDPLHGDTSVERHFISVIVSTALLASVLIGPIVGVFNVGRSRRANDRVRGECAEVLGRLGCRDALCALADLVRGRDERMQAHAITGLWRLLPSLRKRGTPPLTSAESVALARCLPSLPERAAACALDVLQRLGVPSAEFYLVAFADRTDNAAMAQKACRALEAINARRDEEQQRRTLLRPAESAASDSLLRAAASAPTDEALLLRLPSEESAP